MISVSGKKWEQKNNNKNLITKLKQGYNFSDILSCLVLSRKFDETELSSIDNNLKLMPIDIVKDVFRIDNWLHVFGKEF